MAAVVTSPQASFQNTSAVAFSSGIRQIRYINRLLNVEQVLSPAQAQRAENKPDWVLVWGRKSNAKAALAYAQQNSIAVLYLEDGWIRSSAQNPHSRLSYSIQIDSTGVYYDSRSPSDLENLLNLEDDAFNQLVTTEQLAYARECRQLLVEANITKYNYCKTAPRIASQKPTVLVIDQTRDDASVIHGGMDESRFVSMLDAAIAENPNAHIVVRTHPDVVGGRKKGYLTAHAKRLNIEINADASNPLGLIKQAQKVYVGTSQMGYEALLCNKEVVVFGLPFYACWGLTDDRQSLGRRKAQRSIDEIFYATHIHQTRYCNPVTGEAWQLHECLAHVQLQQNMFSRNAKAFHCVGIAPWKRRYLAQFLRSPEGSVSFTSNQQTALMNAKSLLLRKSQSHAKNEIPAKDQMPAKDQIPAKDQMQKCVSGPNSEGATETKRTLEPVLLTWSYRSFKELSNDEPQQVNSLPLMRMEDGFLRSTGLGSDFNAPASLVADERGLYFDSGRESDLEALLNNFDCSVSHISRAVRLKKLILSARLSKYNVGTGSLSGSVPPNTPHLLVVGQVEDDESIKRGCDAVNTNTALLQAVKKARPDAWIRFKPHPDVLAGNRRGTVEQSVLDECADVVDESASIVDCIDACDELHTMSSLSGFEALLRGKSVTTYGAPFYSGWGLTHDKQLVARRTRVRTLDELIYLSLIEYPRYIDIDTGEFTTPEDLVFTINSRRAMNNKRRKAWTGRQLMKATNIVRGLRYAP